MLNHNDVYSSEHLDKIRMAFEPLYRQHNSEMWQSIEVALERRGDHYIESEVDEAFFQFALGYLSCQK